MDGVTVDEWAKVLLERGNKRKSQNDPVYAHRHGLAKLKKALLMERFS